MSRIQRLALTAQTVRWIPENKTGDKRPERETSFQDNPRTTRKLGDSAATRCALNHPLEELLQSADLEVFRNRVNPLAIEAGSLKIFFESAEFRQALKRNVAGTQAGASPAESAIVAQRTEEWIPADKVRARKKCDSQ